MLLLNFSKHGNCKFLKNLTIFFESTMLLILVCYLVFDSEIKFKQKLNSTQV